jgi:hypothetical protein
MGDDLGVPEDLINAFLLALGGNPDVVTMPQLAYIIDGDLLLIFDDMRRLTFLERSQLRLLHATAKERAIRPALPQVLEAAARAAPGTAVEAGAPPPVGSGTLPGGSVYHITQTVAAQDEDDTKKKYDKFLEQGASGTFTMLDKDALAKLRKVHQKLLGTHPEECARPTNEQLSALKGRLASDRTPYADFAIFGPFGRHDAKMRQYEHQILVGDKVITKLFNGPANYEQWLGSWEVYRSAMVMLEAICPGNLDRYSSGIRKLTVLYPHSWSDILVADYEMRWVHMERMLEEADLVTPGLDPERPWDYIMEQAAYGSAKLLGHEWWSDNLVSSLNSPESTQAVLAKLHRRPVDLHRYPANTNGGGGRARGSNQAPPPREVGLCNKYNKAPEGCTEPCPLNYKHACSACGKPGHGALHCQKGSRKGAGKGKALLVHPVEHPLKRKRGQNKKSGK